MDRWRDATVFRLTLVLLAGAFPLVGLGTAGVTAGSSALVGLLAVAGALYGLATAVDGTDLARYDYHEYRVDLPLGPVIGAVVVLAAWGASPGELQALGGLVGLVAMANYFLRPIYHFVYGLGSRLAGV